MADEPTGTQTSATGAQAPAPNLSQYIRTYAKDVAAQTGKGNVGAIPVPKPEPKAAPAPRAQAGRLSPPPAAHQSSQKPRGEVSDGVQFDATEQPFFEKITPKEEGMNYGPVDVGTKADADSIIEKRPSAVPMPASMRETFGTTAPAEEDRGAVLARLKAKMANYVPPAPVPAPPVEEAPVPPQVETPAPVEPFVPPAPPTPPPAPIAPEPVAIPEPVSIPTPPPALPPQPEPAPVFASAPEPPVNPLPPLYREPLPSEEEMRASVMPAPARAPIQPPTPPAPVQAPASDRFHSYATDFTQQVDTTGASAFSVLAAQQDAGTPAQPAPLPRAKRMSMLVIAGSLVLILLSVGGAYGAYRYVASRQVVPTITTKVPSLVFADSTKELKGTGTELLQSLAMASTDALPQGSVMVTYITQQATGEQGVIAGAPAKGGQLIKALDLQAPDILLRNISEDSTVGVTHQGDETRPFFILRVSSYERTFAGMLTWEPLIMRDLGLVYPLYPVEEAAPIALDAPVATSTTKKGIATSTPVIPPTPIQAASKVRFEDAVVSNRDVRILRDTSGKSLILYGYADKETLVIARDEAAFTALIGRLSSDGTH